MVRRPALAVLVPGVAAGLAAFVFLGTSDGALGVAWPSMRASFDQPLSALGLLGVLMTCGYVLASAGHGRLAGRFELRVLAIAGTAMLALSTAAVAVAPGWIAVLAASLLVGLGAGLLDTALNTEASRHSDARVLNLLHAAWGIGAALSPIIVVETIALGFTWRTAYLALASLGACTAVGLQRTRGRMEPASRGAAQQAGAGAGGATPRTDQHGAGQRAGAHGAAEPTEVHGLTQPADPVPALRASAARVSVLLFFLYTGLEVGIGRWCYSVLLDRGTMGTSAAGLWIAAYWLGLAGGRLVLGFVAHLLPVQRVLHTAMGLVLAGLVLFAVGPSGVSEVGLPVTGLGLAPIFPTLVLLTPRWFGALEAPRVIGYQLAAANAGSALLPAGYGLAIGPWSTAGISFLLLATAIAFVSLYWWFARGFRRGV